MTRAQDIRNYSMSKVAKLRGYAGWREMKLLISPKHFSQSVEKQYKNIYEETKILMFAKYWADNRDKDYPTKEDFQKWLTAHI